MANVKISELNSLTKKAYNDVVPIVDTSANETKKVSIEELVNNNVNLIAVSSVAPEECVEGDKYFNTTTNLIYTATDTDTWGTTGESPIEGIFYIVFEEQTTYAYDGTTLVSVGGGASGGGETLPVGAVLEFPTTDSTKVPDGWLFCDGSAVSRTTYADLFAIIGTSWGAGDGSTTFNLPTKEGLVSVGIKSSDTDFNAIGKTGGSKELQEHSHEISVRVGNAGGWTTPLGGDGAGQYTFNTSSAGTGNSGNLQPYTVTNYIIKATQTTPVQAEVVNDYSTSQENTYSCDYINDKLGEVIYSSTSGTSGNITLDKSVADYDEIEIYYHSADNIYGNTGRIPNANNKRIALSAPFNIDTVCYNKYGIIVINNKSLTYYSQFETHIWSGNNGINTGTYFYIDKVVGYKLSQATD